MRILIIEDDPLQAEFVYTGLKRHFAQANIDRIRTESEFQKQFDTVLGSPPDFVIIDIMLRWTDPEPTMTLRPAHTEDFYSAGIRCARMFAKDSRASNTQLILYSVLPSVDFLKDFRDIGDMSHRVFYLQKDSDVENLLNLIRSLSQARGLSTSSVETVFVVHGHDDEAKESVARFIEKLGLSAIILHEQPASGRTVIEKFERYSDVAFAVVVLTPDDVGATLRKREDLRPRARQNVIFELGFFVGKLGRNKVCALFREDVEIPSDYNGVCYIPVDRNGAWRTQLASELRAAGLHIDLNRTM